VVITEVAIWGRDGEGGGFLGVEVCMQGSGPGRMSFVAAWGFAKEDPAKVIPVEC